MSSLDLVCLPSHSPAWFPVCTVRCWPPPPPTSPTACDCEGRCHSWRARRSALPSLASSLAPAPLTTPEGWGKPLLCRHHWHHTLYDRSARGICFNPFTAMLVALSPVKVSPVKVPNLKSLRRFSPFAWEQVKGFLSKCTALKGDLLWDHQIYCLHTRDGDSSVVRAPDSWLKGPGIKSLQERRENFLLQGQLSVLTVMSVSVPPLCYRSST